MRRVLRTGSKKGLSRRHLQGRNTPFRECDPFACALKTKLTRSVCVESRTCHQASNSRRLWLSEFPCWKGFRQISTLLENSSPIFRQHEMLSLPRFGHSSARRMAAGKSALPSGTSGFSPPRPPTTVFFSCSDSKFSCKNSKNWVHALTGVLPCVCVKWRIFVHVCAFKFALFCTFVCISVLFFLPKWPAEKRKIAQKFCKNVDTALLCNTPFSYTPRLRVTEKKAPGDNRHPAEHLRRSGLLAFPDAHSLCAAGLCHM